jgi:hypothetical protein
MPTAASLISFYVIIVEKASKVYAYAEENEEILAAGNGALTVQTGLLCPVYLSTF